MRRHWPLLAAALVNALVAAFNVRNVCIARTLLEAFTAVVCAAITVACGLFMVATFIHRTRMERR